MIIFPVKIETQPFHHSCPTTPVQTQLIRHEELKIVKETSGEQTWLAELSELEKAMN